MVAKINGLPGPQPGVLYDREEARRLCGFVSEAALEAAIADGRFPQPVQPTAKARARWSGEALQAWLFLQPMLRRPEPPQAPAKQQSAAEESPAPADGPAGEADAPVT
jgi:hypothetical protein